MTNRNISLRAQQAAARSPELTREVKHLVHVLALLADCNTGRGLAGQATIAFAMGCSTRTVARLWDQLDASWAAGGPVGTIRKKRWRTSDRYTLLVQPGADLVPFPRQSDTGDSGSDTGDIVAAAYDANRLTAEALGKTLPRLDVTNTPPFRVVDLPPVAEDRRSTSIEVSPQGKTPPKKSPSPGATAGASPGMKTLPPEWIAGDGDSVFALAAARRRARLAEREAQKQQ